MEPKLVDFEGALLQGRLVHTSVRDGRNTVEIPAAWQRAFAEDLFGGIAGRPEGQQQVCYGAVAAYRSETLELDYLIGVEVEEGSVAPQGLSLVELAAGEYAVFLTPPAANEQEFHEAMRACWEYIFEQWLPRSGRTQRNVPTFERYDERSDADRPDRQCEVWIPLLARDAA